MKQSGMARKAALNLIFWSFAILAGIFVVGFVATVIGTLISKILLALIVVWLFFVLFTLYFFRDPDARSPVAPGLIVAPAHGKVDVVDQFTEPFFIGGACQRVSIFLSVIDIHVQNAPITGRLAFYRYTAGKFMNALNTECAAHNENALLGFTCSERPGVRIGVRLIAGLIARRIVPFVFEGDEVHRGERISLIQFGSRTDLYLPLTAKIQVKIGDRVVGGETVMATFD